MSEDLPITVVSGLPRSGTSLMMQMLAAGGLPVLTDRLRAADEDNPRGYFEFEPVKRTKLSRDWLRDARGKAVKIVHLLLFDLPTSGPAFRVLLMKRRMDEVLASQRAMLQRQGKAGANLSCEQLGGLFLSQLAGVRDWVQQQPNFSLLEVDYNQLIEHPRPPIAAINVFLGNRLDESAMGDVIDSSLYRQRT